MYGMMQFSLKLCLLLLLLLLPLLLLLLLLLLLPGCVPRVWHGAAHPAESNL
jgi:hypothetical protein